MNTDLPGWLAPLAQQLEPWLPALTITGVIMAVASLVALPWFLVRIPENYFTQAYSPHQNRGVAAWLVWLLRNLLAILLLVAGILMLILPGQGLLTILIAIMTSTFPGKYRLERAIMRRPGVFRAANWIRARYHRRPLEHPDAFKEPSHGHYPQG